MLIAEHIASDAVVGTMLCFELPRAAIVATIENEAAAAEPSRLPEVAVAAAVEELPSPEEAAAAEPLRSPEVAVAVEPLRLPEVAEEEVAGPEREEEASPLEEVPEPEEAPG